MAEVRQKKPEQILQLKPNNELVFKGPFKDVVATTLTLSNPTDKTVAFKVKTTAPRHYCVKPNCGVVSPNGEVLVDVMLQPFDYNASDNKRHKFMVQTMVVPNDSQDIEGLWKVGDPSTTMDSKLKCVFQMPTESQSPDDDETSTSRARDQAATSQTPTQSPAPAFTSPAAKTPSQSLSASSAFEQVPKSPGNENQTKESSPEPTPTTTAQSHSSAVSQKQIEEQSESLKAENLRLKKELADLKEEGPKQRLIKEQPFTSAPATAGMNMSQELNASQISPILAAIIALLIGYLIGKFIL